MCLKERNVPKFPLEEIATNHVDLDIAWNDNCAYTDYDDYITLDKLNSDLTVLAIKYKRTNKQADRT